MVNPTSAATKRQNKGITSLVSGGHDVGHQLHVAALTIWEKADGSYERRLFPDIALHKGDYKIDGSTVRAPFNVLWPKILKALAESVWWPSYQRHYLWLSRMPQAVQEAGHLLYGGWPLLAVADLHKADSKVLKVPDLSSVMANDVSGSLMRFYAREGLPADRRMFVLTCELIKVRWYKISSTLRAKIRLVSLPVTWVLRRAPLPPRILQAQMTRKFSI
jgi:hypothetical protein